MGFRQLKADRTDRTAEWRVYAHCGAVTAADENVERTVGY